MGEPCQPISNLEMISSPIRTWCLVGGSQGPQNANPNRLLWTSLQVSRLQNLKPAQFKPKQYLGVQILKPR